MKQSIRMKLKSTSRGRLIFNDERRQLSGGLAVNGVTWMQGKNDWSIFSVLVSQDCWGPSSVSFWNWWIAVLWKSASDEHPWHHLLHSFLLLKTSTKNRKSWFSTPANLNNSLVFHSRGKLLQFLPDHPPGEQWTLLISIVRWNRENSINA